MLFSGCDGRVLLSWVLHFVVPIVVPFFIHTFNFVASRCGFFSVVARVVFGVLCCCGILWGFQILYVVVMSSFFIYA